MAKLIFRLLVTLLGFSFTFNASAEPDRERQQQLRNMVRQDCGSCHGLTLKGGLGPALTPDALNNKPMESLHATIIHGRSGTPMPPFRGMLTDEEVNWIVEQLVKGDV